MHCRASNIIMVVFIVQVTNLCEVRHPFYKLQGVILEREKICKPILTNGIN